jgi:hypothetical protein
VVLASVLYLGRDSIDAWMAPSGPRATVASTSGGVYGLPGGALRTGAAIGDREVVRTGPGAHAVLRLADGSTVDVNERTEVFVTAAWSGQTIHLQRGDVIVQAAKQRRGHLRVLTRDSIASVKGTVFAVSSGMVGSVVSVVEGSVQVRQPGHDRLLKPGEQAFSHPALASSVAEAVSWSPQADEYVQLLSSFAAIGERMTQVSSPLRTSSVLLARLPAGAFVYGAVPNPGGNINEGLLAAEQQAFENAAFRDWWQSETGVKLRQIVDRMRAVSTLLGDEVVFTAAMDGSSDVPMVIAQVQSGRREALASELAALYTTAGETSAPYSVSDDLMVISDSEAHLAWALSQLGKGAGSPFATAIGERYARGAGWFMAVDAAPVVALAGEDDAPPIELARLAGLKYLFFEQRSPSGAEENEVTAVFQGERTGLASWLANGGSGGAAEFLAPDAILAGYVSMREPGQLFRELSALMATREPAFSTEVESIESIFGAGFVTNLTAAMGTEAAFALHGFTMTGPTWVLSMLVNDAAVVESSIRKFVEVCNANAPAEDPSQGCVLTQETANGLVWSTLKSGSLPVGMTWTSYGGYLVAASDRATGERAIATRNAGSALVWSSAFQTQLPASVGLHPSAFMWLNAKGVLDFVSALAPDSPLTTLLARREPTLVVFDGMTDRIRVASRTRLSAVMVDAMLLGGLSDSMR